MEGYAAYKIPGGKLVKIKITFNNTIENVQILGDFFIHPEEMLRVLENGLQGVELHRSFIIDRIKTIVEERDIQMIGITPEGIADAIKEATL